MKYVGAPVSVTADVAYKSYVDSVKSADLDSGTVDALIDSGLSSYATLTYVDAQDALLVTPSYVDTQDNLRIKTNTKDVANGVAALDATGKVDQNRLNVASTQKFWRGPWTPSAYNSALTGVSTESDLYSVPVTDPGFPYKLVVFGVAEGRSDLAGQWPQINVRVGSTAGTIIAQGVGGAETVEVPTGVIVTDDFERTNATGIGSNWSTADTTGSSDDGVAAIRLVDGHTAELSRPDGTINSNVYRRHRRVTSGEDVTGGDNQIIKVILGDGGFNSRNAYLDVLGRTSTTIDSYVAVRLGIQSVGFRPKVSGFAEGGPFGSATFINSVQGDEWTCVFGEAGAPRQFRALKNGVQVTQWLDNTNISTLGSSNRCWGFGMNSPGTSVLPPRLDSIQLTDGLTSPNLNTIRIVPLSLDTQASRTGTTTVYVRLVRSGGASTVQATNYSPKIFVMAVPA